MNEVEFRNWLIKNNVAHKVASDTVSRLKRIEREIKNCDINEQYRSDRCEYLLSLFLNMGNNEEMRRLSMGGFPIGKYYMSTYRYALKYYVRFCDETISNIL